MKIIDSFIFFNEFDIIEGRFKYLYDHVDYFVITECDHTHSGDPKAMLFAEHMEKFSEYQDKIIYNPLSVNPQDFLMDDGSFDSMKLDKFQRNYVTNVLDQFDNNDIFLISDADEIHNIEIIDQLRAHFSNAEVPPIILGQEYYMYNLERKQRNPGGFDGYWFMPFAAQKHHLLIYPASDLRGWSNTPNLPRIVIRNAGWHLHCFLTPEEIMHKLKYYAHNIYFNHTNVELVKTYISQSLSFVGGYHELEIMTREHFPESFLAVFGKYFHIHPRSNH